MTEHVPGVRSVSLGAWIGTGSSHEHYGEGGYAHFLEHLLFKGNARIDAAGISRWFDSIGTDANAATTREYTVVHARVIDRHVPRSLAVLGEMVLAPSIEKHDVDAEREVILEEIAMYDDSPSDVVHEVADALVFWHHPLGSPIVGTDVSINAATAERMRAFHAAQYGPQRIVVSAAGAVDHDMFVTQVSEHFAAQDRGVVYADGIDFDRAPERPLEAPHLHEPRACLREKETEQAHLVLAGRGIRRDDERRYAAALLDTIFGNAPSSRLFLEIREQRGLAYSVYSFMSSYARTGEFGVYVGVRPDRAAQVCDILRAELDRVLREPPSADELERAKGHLEGRLLLSLESTTVRGNRLGASLVTDMPIEPLERVVERIQAVTAQDVLELARDVYDPSRMSFAAVAEDVEVIRSAARDAGLFPAQEVDVLFA